MSSFAAIANPQRKHDAERMLAKLAHRGGTDKRVFEGGGAYVCASEHVWPRWSPSLPAASAWVDTPPPDLTPNTLASWPLPFALAAATEGGLLLARDRMGARPLYFGYSDGDLCAATEVKALAEITTDVREFPPGHYYTSSGGFCRFAEVRGVDIEEKDPDSIAKRLRSILEEAIGRVTLADGLGVWLSGGVDSSVIASLASLSVPSLRSFVIGLPGSTDVEYGGIMARHLGIRHQAVTVSPQELIAALPDAIAALESFDALLVRSSVTNWLVSRIVADHVPAVLSGEGGDELFAGYEYMKAIPEENLTAELGSAVASLSNTAFQRVDRSAHAHGLVPLLPFADAAVTEYALGIPVSLKLKEWNGRRVEKWILRKAVEGLVPENVLWRPKTKFWQGTGVQDILSEHAERTVSDADFRRERVLPNGWSLNTKEELWYYRLFAERLGGLASLDWMGRTKGAPVSS
ncbi:MAG: asparagine synthase [Spirochaetia bacterium]|nr:asparagine synthase [Spirochaetia bacterium]